MAQGRDIELSLGTHTLSRGCELKDDHVKGRIYGNPDGPVIIVPVSYTHLTLPTKRIV